MKENETAQEILQEVVRTEPLSRLSIVIPARDEEGCVRSTVEHLHLELNLHHVPHEIVVVDDGSQDKTWQILTELTERIPELRPVQNTGLHGFGRRVADSGSYPRQPGLRRDS